MGSRTEPVLPLGRMRANRQLIELGQRELALTDAEAGELLENIGLRLSPAQIEVISARTEGWPAATYLAGLALADQPDLGAAVQSFAGDDRFIVDYLRDEFLATTSETRMRFLTRSALLDELTGPACDFVLDRKGAARVLKELASSNALVVPLDRGDTTYRYHHLFAELLQSEMRRREPELEATLHSRASRWYDEQGDSVRAIDHAIAADEPDRAGRAHLAGFPGAQRSRPHGDDQGVAGPARGDPGEVEQRPLAHRSPLPARCRRGRWWRALGADGGGGGARGAGRDGCGRS